MAAHSLGHAAMQEMESTIHGIASLLGVKPQEIIFTSGASEANNLAIKGTAKAYEHVGKHILSTCLEHPSISGTLSALQLQGYEIELVKIDKNGQIDLDYLKRTLRKDTVLLCVSAVDSELGVIQPLDEIAQIVQAFPNCHLHIDAAQAMGKIPLDISKLMAVASTLVFSPHKFYGLGGTGVLVKREDIVLMPIIHGGKSMSLYRSGTPALGLAACTFTALQLALHNLEAHNQHVSGMRNFLVSSLTSMHPQRVRFNSPLQNSSPYILNISITGTKGKDIQKELDALGICVSVKSACSTDNAPSRPVMATTGDKKNALASWRISFSHLTTMQEVETLISAISQIIR